MNRKTNDTTEKTVKLSARLAAVAALVEPGSRVADVGTDHGYIPIYLVQTGIADRAIAMDVRSGPLERARAHVDRTAAASTAAATVFPSFFMAPFLSFV